MIRFVLTRVIKALALQCVLVGAVLAHGVTLKVQHFLPADSAFHTQFLLPWTKKLEEESHGLLRFQLFPAMQLGGTPAQLFDQVKDGKADIVWTLAEHTPGRFAATELFQLPLMGRSAQGASRALWEYAQANNLARGEFAGARVLALHTQDAAQPPLSASVGVLAMNPDSYKLLTKEMRQLLNAHSGAETSAWLGRVFDAASAKQSAGEPGEAAARAVEDWVKQADQRGLNGKELLESARGLLAQHDR